MPINFGSKLSSADANATFLDKTIDDETTGKVGLKNTDLESGNPIDNAQQYINEIADADGTNGEGDTARKDYSSTNFIANGDSRKAALEKIDAQVKTNADDIAAFTSNNSLLRYQGTWDAATNTPTLSDVTGVEQYWYRVNVAGSQDLGSGSIAFNVDDKVVHNGTVWEKWDTTDEVTSVNSQTGEVVLDADDIAETTRKWAIQHNRNALVDPAVTDDSASGYVIGSTWFNSVDGTKFTLQDASVGAAVWVETGGGSGIGAINYIINSDFEKDADDVFTYKDAAQIVPEDGIGGSPTLTFTQTTADPMVGDGSGVITKPPSNAQGEGVRIAMTNIDKADRGKVFVLRMEVEAGDSNYDTGDLKVFFKDGTNNVIYRMNNEDIESNNAYQHLARVQIPRDCSTGSILIHCAATHTSGFIVKIDRVIFGPQSVSYAPIIKDWIDFSPTGSWTTNTLYEGQYKRVGDTMHVRMRLGLSGAPNATALTVNIPDGLSVDDTKIPQNAAFPVLGSASFYNVTNTYIGKVLKNPANATSLLIFYLNDLSSEERVVAVNQAAPFTFANNHEVYIEFAVPIVGWDSNAVTSEEFSGTEVIVEAETNAATAVTANVTDIPFTTEIRDTAAAWDGSQFTAPEKGEYYIHGSIFLSSAIVGSIDAYVNGTRVRRIGRFASSTTNEGFGGAFTLVKGDTLSVRIDQSATLNNSSVFPHWIHIQKLATGKQILETESIACRYTSDSGQTVSSGGGTYVFEDLDYDTHAAYNSSTGVYTVVNGGRYFIHSAVRSGNNETLFELSIAVNGTVQSSALTRAGSATTIAAKVTDILDLDRGDTIEIVNNQGANKTLNTNSVENYLAISRIK